MGDHEEMTQASATPDDAGTAGDEAAREGDGGNTGETREEVGTETPRPDQDVDVDVNVGNGESGGDDAGSTSDAGE